MTLETRTLISYTVACDGCDTAMEYQPLAVLAAGEAIEAGWQRIARWNGLEFYERWFCPECAEKEKEET